LEQHRAVKAWHDKGRAVASGWGGAMVSERIKMPKRRDELG
jgi:hypothetical protein